MMSTPAKAGECYGSEYYRVGCGPIPYQRNSHWLNFFSGIADTIVRQLRPRKVYDAGCALGMLVEAFHDRGVEANGADISQFAIDHVRPDMRPYCTVRSVTEPVPGGPYDLVTCIEVLEHVSEAEAQMGISELVKVTDAILFSSTPDDFNESTHVNVHPIIYWLKAFARHNFYPDLMFDGSFIAPHAFLVVKRPDPVGDDVLLMFSEILRFRIDRVNFLRRHGRIEELEGEVASLRHQLGATTLELDARRQSDDRIEALASRISGASRFLPQPMRPDSRAAIEPSPHDHPPGTWASRVESALEDAAQLLSDFPQNLEEERMRLARAETAMAEGGALNLQLQSDLRRLSEERDALQARESALSAILAEFSAVYEANVDSQLDSLQQAAFCLTAAKEAKARWSALLQSSESSRREARELVSDLQKQLEEMKLQVLRSEELTEQWMANSEELSHNLEVLSRRHDAMRGELQSLHGSPGWRLITAYREWLWNARVRNRWVNRYWEPTAIWAFRHFVPGPATLAPLPDPAPAYQRSMILDKPERRHTLAQALPPAAESHSGEDSYETWISRNEPNEDRLQLQRRISACFTYRPKISILVPVYKVPLPVLREMVDSVLIQTYDNWELCITVPNADNPEGATFLQQAAANDPRIRVSILAANEGISGNSNRALALATGEYCALIDHDDTIAPFALFEVVQLLNHDPTADFIYSDKDQITEDGGQRLQPLLKPRWSPDIMLNANYLTHLCVMRTEDVHRVGGWRKETDGAQDWDLFLRLVIQCRNVQHIPKVLYHWRQIRTSVAAAGLEAKPYAAAGQVRAVKDYCEALGLEGCEVRHEQGTLRIEWPGNFQPKVSVVYLSQASAADAIARASSLAEQTIYPNFELILPIPGSAGATSPIRVISTASNSTLLERIEAAVRVASGEVLVFFDENLTPMRPDWLTEITGPLRLPGVGMTGGKVIDASTRALRHCGLVFTRDGRVEYIYAGQPEHVCEQAGTASWYRDWSAVAGACIAIRRDIWNTVDGMSGPALHSRPDIHLSLKVRQQTGSRIFYNPYVRFLQTGVAAFESPLGDDGHVSQYLRASFPEGDPYFNPNLDCRNGKVVFRTPDRASAAGTDYTAEARALVQIYDFAPATAERSRSLNARPATHNLESVTWFVPEFGNPFYGGIHTILRFADGLRRAHNISSQFCVLGHAPETRVRNQIAAAFPELAASSRIFVLDDHRRSNQLPRTDAGICSLWTTAYALLESDMVRRKFYFMQDDEALFYPAGSTSAMVEATYGFGYHAICNTRSLLKRYAARGGQGEYFDPCVDPAVFHSRNRKSIGAPGPFLIFCYGRPNHPRNCFELLASTLRLLKQRLRDRVVIVTAGEEWEPRDYGLDGIVQNLGLLNYETTGALYRACDAGLVMMMTRHMSYLPMELMACGALVITNQNPDTTWLLQDSRNCLLADLSPTSFADRIEKGLTDLDLRRAVTGTARSLVEETFTNWEAQVEKIYRYMMSVC